MYPILDNGCSLCVITECSENIVMILYFSRSIVVFKWDMETHFRKIPYHFVRNIVINRKFLTLAITFCMTRLKFFLGHRNRMCLSKNWMHRTKSTFWTNTILIFYSTHATIANMVWIEIKNYFLSIEKKDTNIITFL